VKNKLELNERRRRRRRRRVVPILLEMSFKNMFYFSNN
jgi:hypothetical protein